jgi:hypothetical protein
MCFGAKPTPGSSLGRGEVGGRNRAGRLDRAVQRPATDPTAAVGSWRLLLSMRRSSTTEVGRALAVEVDSGG